MIQNVGRFDFRDRLLVTRALPQQLNRFPSSKLDFWVFDCFESFLNSARYVVLFFVAFIVQNKIIPFPLTSLDPSWHIINHAFNQQFQREQYMFNKYDPHGKAEDLLSSNTFVSVRVCEHVLVRLAGEVNCGTVADYCEVAQVFKTA